MISSGEKFELRAGDAALVLYGAAHTLGRMDRRYGSSIGYTLDHWEEVDEPSVLRFGSKAGDLRVLSCRLQLTRTLRSAPTNRALTHILRPPAPLFTELTPLEAACRGPGAAAFVFGLAQLYLCQTLRAVHDDLKALMPSAHRLARDGAHHLRGAQDARAPRKSAGR